MGEILVYLFCGAIAVGVLAFAAAMIWAALDGILRWILRVRRVYGGSKGGFDREGIRHYRIPDHLQAEFAGMPRYYGGFEGVMIPASWLGTALGSDLPTYCVAYISHADKAFIVKRAPRVARGVSRRMSKRMEEIDLDDYLPALRLLDQHHNPWRYEPVAVSIGEGTPDARDRTRFTCDDCGVSLIGMSSLRRHRDAMHAEHASPSAT
jgi:hypothetical protein